MVKGKDLDEALKISNKTVAKALGGLPPIKMHCSNLAADGLAKAIEDYQKKSKKSQDSKDSSKDKDKDKIDIAAK